MRLPQSLIIFFFFSVLFSEQMIVVGEVFTESW